MPRTGLSKEEIIQKAAQLANEKGLSYVTVTMRIPLERNSLHASAGRLSAPNGKFFKLHWITHVLAI